MRVESWNLAVLAWELRSFCCDSGSRSLLAPNCPANTIFGLVSPGPPPTTDIVFDPFLCPLPKGQDHLRMGNGLLMGNQCKMVLQLC
jgi:hypothetical protein